MRRPILIGEGVPGGGPAFGGFPPDLGLVSLSSGLFVTSTPPAPPPVLTMNVPLILHHEGYFTPADAGHLANLAALVAAHPFLVRTFLWEPLSVHIGDIPAALATIIGATGEVGLHLHPHNILQVGAGISGAPRPFPTAAGPTASLGGGYYTLLTAFSQAELEALFDFQLAVFAANGIPAPKVFTAGYWINTPAGLAALASRGFTHDASPVPVATLSPTFDSFPYLLGLVGARWPTVNVTTPPYTEGGITQVVSSSAVASYNSAADIFSWFQTSAAAADLRPSKRGTFPLAIHSDGSGVDHARAKDALDLIVPWAAANGVTLVSTKVSAITPDP